jgi:hypothetical protein
MKIWVVFAVAAFLPPFLICLPLPAADSAQSDAERLKILEDAVRQLQQRNAEQEQRNAKLEVEVRELKSRNAPFAPVLAEPERKATAGNDNKAVFTAPPPPLVDVHPGGSEFKLTLGGYLQINLESGDVSAFEGRFGENALKDRFRLRRARVNLIGDSPSNSISKSKAISVRATAFPTVAPLFRVPTFSLIGTPSRKRM